MKTRYFNINLVDLTERRTFWIGKGIVTDPDAHEGKDTAVGDIEWQFSDGPAGERSCSYDFTGDLFEAMATIKADYPDCTFVIDNIK